MVMVDCLASNNNYYTKLVQNTSTHNKRKVNYNYFKNVLSKKRWHPSIDFDSILFDLTKDINIHEWQGLLKYNDLINKLATRITHGMLISISN